jgi:hypothetical protein
MALVALAYAVIFRLVLPIGMVPAFADTHSLCISQSAGDFDGWPTAPLSEHPSCEHCCLNGGAPSLPSQPASFTIAPILAANLEALANGLPDIRGPPAAEAWSIPRAQRGPPAFRD